MLQTNATRSPAYSYAVKPRDPVLRQGDLRRTVRRLGPLALACALCGAVIAGLWSFMTVPTYVATTQLLIEPQRQQPILLGEPGMLDLTLDNAQVESQVELLRSERIATAVAGDLNLIEDPEFQKDESLMPWRYLFGTSADGERDREALRVASGILTGRVGVRRIGQSYVIEITARSERPQRAAEIANAYTDAYMRDQFDAKARSARGGVEWLHERLKEVRENSSDAARAVEDFRAKHGLVSTGNGLLIEQELGETNTQYVSARSQTAQLAARLSRVKAIGVDGLQDSSVSEVISNQNISNLRQRRQDVLQRETYLRERFGGNNPAVASARLEVLAVEREIDGELHRIAQVYQSEYDIAVARERSMADEVRRLISESDRLRQAKVTLSELDAQAQTYRKMYQNMLERLAETIQKETLPVSNARVVAQASIPLGKSSPKTKLALALGATLGLLLGIAAGTVRQKLDGTLRSAADVARSGPLECLGLLPKSAERGDVARVRVFDEPFSPFTRAMRGLKISLDAAQGHSRATTLGVASVASDDGKSNVALNLAALYAQAGHRTVLIDADFQQGTLTGTLCPGAKRGLLDALADGTQELVETQVKGLSFLPLVQSRRVAQSGEILRSQRMQDLIATLTESHDLVILDLTAMQAAVDVRAVGRLLDGLMLVATWGGTDVATLTQAAASLDAAQANIFGVVLNKVDDPDLIRQAI